MLAIIEAAGWPIWPLLLASVIALAIIGERMWSLRQNIVMPRNLLAHVVQEYRQSGVTPVLLSRLSMGSPLGQMLFRHPTGAGAARSDEDRYAGGGHVGKDLA